MMQVGSMEEARQQVAEAIRASVGLGQGGGSIHAGGAGDASGCRRDDDRGAQGSWTMCGGQFWRQCMTCWFTQR